MQDACASFGPMNAIAGSVCRAGQPSRNVGRRSWPTPPMKGDSRLDFSLTNTQSLWLRRVRDFMRAEVYPSIPVVRSELARSGRERWWPSQRIEELKARARAQGLWNLFLPPSDHDSQDFRGAGLSNLEYALCAQEMGRVPWASEVFNCSAPDTGNMEVVHRYGSPAQKAKRLKPLLAGGIPWAFLMTEPQVASSDATNIETSIRREGDEYIVNGRKWWSSGVGDPRCKVMIVMGKTDPSAPKHQAQSQVVVPADAKGVKIEKMLPVFGFDDAPHGHAQVLLENVRVPVGNILLGEGRGFEIAQGRLGPGRIHHCMRTIGKAEEALEKMVRRLSSRTAFGRKIIEYSIWEQRIAEARTDIEMNRLLCLKAADMMDKVGNKSAQLEIAMIKVAAPNMALKIIDNAIQAFGGAGVSDEAGLARDYASMRTMRLADGPDEVHNRAIARLELRKYANSPTTR